MPSDATLTGAWTLGQVSAEALPQEGLTGIYVPISFSIPLEEELEGGEWKPGATPTPIEDPGQVHFISPTGEEVFLNEETFAMEEEEPQSCPGSAAEPLADPGHLCIYAGNLAQAASASNLIGPVDGGGFSPGPPAFGGGGVGASTSGAVLSFPRGGAPSFFLTANGFGWGSWAVTAE